MLASHLLLKKIILWFLGIQYSSLVMVWGNGRVTKGKELFIKKSVYVYQGKTEEFGRGKKRSGGERKRHAGKEKKKEVVTL